MAKAKPVLITHPVTPKFSVGDVLRHPGYRNPQTVVGVTVRYSYLMEQTTGQRDWQSEEWAQNWAPIKAKKKGARK